MVKKATELLIRLKGKRWPYVAVAVVSLVVSCCTMVTDRTVTEEGDRKVTETKTRIDFDRALELLEEASRHLDSGNPGAAKVVLSECKHCLEHPTAPAE